MNRAVLWLLDLLYPNTCDCCGVRIPFDASVCENCRAELSLLKIANHAWYSHEPSDTVYPWDGLVTVYHYDKAARKGVLALKDGHRGFLALAAEELSARITETFADAQIDCVTFVPVTKKRRRRQGFSHGELLAKAIGKRIAVQVRGDLLCENGMKLRQHQLTAAERKIYAERFSHTGRDLSGQTVLLCDDILTTGSTLMRCTHLLKECGAKRVLIAVCACRFGDEESAKTS